MSISLGISGRRRNGASALAVDGRVVAAVSEASVTRVPGAGYRETGFPEASAAECLRIAGVSAGDVQRIVSADRTGSAPLTAFSGARARNGGSPHASVHALGRSTAQAWQAVAVATAPSLIFVHHGRGAPWGNAQASLFRLTNGRPVLIRDLAGVAQLASLHAEVARLLGWQARSGASALEFLETLAHGDGEPDRASFDGLLSVTDDVAVDRAGLVELVRSRAVSGGHALDDVESPFVLVHRARAALASGLVDASARATAQVLGRWLERERLGSLVLAGDAFTAAAFNSRLSALVQADTTSVPVPETEGCALGAALAEVAAGGPAALEGLALGPRFSEAETKAALENARLDYLYEPSWGRLLARVSSLLSRGKLVAWFEGATDFGPRSLGGRSVLCDPSDRYVRDNVNRFLKQRTDAASLPVSLAAEAADECLESSAPSPWMLWRARVRPEHRDRLRSAVDADGQVTYHTVVGPPHQALADLLRVHRERTGVPALINTTLAGPGEPTASSPRDAIRSAYSSAVDALVLQRFIVMKDYWQMRADVE
jgi:carbamoyltransferase